MILYRYTHSLNAVLTIQSGDMGSLDAVVAALKAQTLSKRHWRLTVVDETGKEPEALAERFLWHPRVTLVKGETEGPATTTIQAMLASRTDLVAVLDGRTCLAPDYLEKVLELASAHPFVGIFGGSANLASSSPEPTWQASFLRLLGIREVRQEKILQVPDRRWMPGPSGYVVRREHLRRFSHILRYHPFFKESGFRRQKAAFDYRAGLARTVIQAGFSIGMFPALKLTRMVGGRDLRERCIQELLRREAFSRVLERFVWAGRLPQSEAYSTWEKVALSWLRTWQFGRLPRLRQAHRLGLFSASELARKYAARPTHAPSLGSSPHHAESSLRATA